MPRPSDAVILERAKSFCNEAIFTVALQHRRLQTNEPEDGEFIFRWHADLQFFIVALRRLRRAVELGAEVPNVSATLTAALTVFDDRLPGLAKMRNVGEHINDYMLGDGHIKDIQRGGLQVSKWDGTVFTWLGVELDIDAALRAAEALFEVVKLSVRSQQRKRRRRCHGDSVGPEAEILLTDGWLSRLDRRVSAGSGTLPSDLRVACGWSD